MLCNELPLNTFSDADDKVAGKTGKARKKVTISTKDEVDSGELDQEDIAVIIYPADEMQSEDAVIVPDETVVEEIEDLVLPELVDINSDRELEQPIDAIQQFEMVDELSGGDEVIPVGSESEESDPESDGA